jgi:hypothetical protein
MDFEDQLATAMRTSVETLTPPVADLVSVGLVRGRRRRRRTQVAAALASVAALTLAGAGTAILRHQSDDTSNTITAAGPGCNSVIRTGVLPSWARDGFSDPEPAVPHVLSANGDMAAILFGGTLHSPPGADVNNKILWVARVTKGDPGSLFIDAVRAGTTKHVRREVPGSPGPSTIDLPQPGCWHLTLHWGAQRDTIDLDYQRP